MDEHLKVLRTEASDDEQSRSLADGSALPNDMALTRSYRSWSGVLDQELVGTSLPMSSFFYFSPLFDLANLWRG